MKNLLLAALSAAMTADFWLNAGLTTLFFGIITYGWQELRIDDKLSP